MEIKKTKIFKIVFIVLLLLVVLFFILGEVNKAKDRKVREEYSALGNLVLSVNCLGGEMDVSYGEHSSTLKTDAQYLSWVMNHDRVAEALKNNDFSYEYRFDEKKLFLHTYIINEK